MRIGFRRALALAVIGQMVCCALAIGQSATASLESGPRLDQSWTYETAADEPLLLAPNRLPPVTAMGQTSVATSSQSRGFATGSAGIISRHGALACDSSPSFFGLEESTGSPWSPAASFWDNGNGACFECDEVPRRGIIALVGYDSWRGVSDGSWQNNGIHSGLNFGTRLGRISDWTGIGFQIGGTAAAYDWAGTDYRTRNQNQAEPQGFITYGFFRKTNENSRWNAALVQDWMLNSNFGEFAQNPTLGQWRGQLGYALSPWNEIGIWGTWRLHGDSRDIPGVGPTSWRSINQLNVFAHHKWGAGGPDTSIWIGVPEHDRLAGGGSLGDWIVGLRGDFPLSDRAAVYTLVTYMHQSAAPGPIAASEDAWNFSIGLAFYPSYSARSTTVAGRAWLPQLPVANNGYFLVDTNRVF